MVKSPTPPSQTIQNNTPRNSTVRRSLQFAENIRTRLNAMVTATQEESITELELLQQERDVLAFNPG